ncbi:MAG: hypothetical protein UT44_C0051G0002 [Candidatus Levybacteria bacterium GW2011_GWA1_39_32]|nr:MAG: hypothetical protein UT44_C0051G0002 [Candidatus Levybacteria bacterium GW2011_GWA1_39_32]
MAGGCGSSVTRPPALPESNPTNQGTVDQGTLDEATIDFVDCQDGPFSAEKSIGIPKGETVYLGARRQSDHEEIRILISATGGSRYNISPENTDIDVQSIIGGFMRLEASGVIFNLNATSDSIIGDLSLDVSANCS